MYAALWSCHDRPCVWLQASVAAVGLPVASKYRLAEDDTCNMLVLSCARVLSFSTHWSWSIDSRCLASIFTTCPLSVYQYSIGCFFWWRASEMVITSKRARYSVRRSVYIRSSLFTPRHSLLFIDRPFLFSLTLPFCFHGHSLFVFKHWTVFIVGHTYIFIGNHSLVD